jgi:hypothetical protein
MVSQSIAHAGDLLPRNVRALLLSTLSELLNSLTNDLELSDPSILTHPISHEPTDVYSSISLIASPCPPGVWPGPRHAGKCDPSRGRDRRADDRGDRGALPGSGDGADARHGPTRHAPPHDTPARNTCDRDHTRCRSQRAGCNAGTFSGEAARPRRRRGRTLRLDTARKPWHKKDDWLGPAKHRGGHRGSGALVSRPSSRPTASPSAYQHLSVISRGRSAAAASARRLPSRRPPSACTALRSTSDQKGSEEVSRRRTVQICAVLDERRHSGREPCERDAGRRRTRRSSLSWL